MKTNFKAMQSFENGRDADQVLALEVVLKRWRGGSGHEKLKLSDCREVGSGGSDHIIYIYNYTISIISIYIYVYIYYEHILMNVERVFQEHV